MRAPRRRAAARVVSVLPFSSGAAPGASNPVRLEKPCLQEASQGRSGPRAGPLSTRSDPDMLGIAVSIQVSRCEISSNITASCSQTKQDAHMSSLDSEPGIRRPVDQAYAYVSAKGSPQLLCGCFVSSLCNDKSLWFQTSCFCVLSAVNRLPHSRSFQRGT